MKYMLFALWMGSTLLCAEEVIPPNKTAIKNGIVYAKILEKREVMGYDYLRVERNGTQEWVAVAKSPASVGDTIGYDRKTVMQNFKSKGLDRVFEKIVFANELYLPTKHTTPVSMKSVLQKDIERASQKDVAADFKEKPIYSIEEVHRYRKQLNGKRVTVKARVYKVSKDIMKRDWVHLGDGTGSEKKLTDDLVFTAKNTRVKAGDTVKASANIVVDKDFGYGYFYSVMGEDATFTAQQD